MVSNVINKRKLHHTWTVLRPLSPWVFLILAVIFGLIGVYSLRENNLRAIELRVQVLEVDKEDGDVESALRELREFVHSHMNADLAGGPTAIRPSIQLKYRYERLVQAEKDRVSAKNEKIYTDAQRICEQRFPTGLSGSGRIPCIEEYVSQNGVTQQPIPDDFYKFDFVAPRWSFDRAGISLLLSVLFAFFFGVRFSLELWLRSQLD